MAHDKVVVVLVGYVPAANPKVGVAMFGTMGVKLPELTVLPHRLYTVIGPVVAPAGTRTLMEVALLDKIVAFFPPVKTTESGLLKVVPEITTVAVPTFPLVGVNPETTDPGLIVAVEALRVPAQPNSSVQAT